MILNKMSWLRKDGIPGRSLNIQINNIFYGFKKFVDEKVQTLLY